MKQLDCEYYSILGAKLFPFSFTSSTRFDGLMFSKHILWSASKLKERIEQTEKDEW